MSSLVLCTFVYALFVSCVSGWNLFGSFAHFDIIKTNDAINMSIVATTSKASSVSECLSRDYPIDSSSTSVRSFYFDTTAGICYFNNDLDTTITADVDAANASVYYCESRKSYRKEVSGTGERIVVNDKSYGSCSEVFEDGFRHAYVYKTNELVPDTPCNDSWIVFQRRIDGSVDFFRGWDDYVNGFGNGTGEFWLGLENIHQLTINDTCELYIYLKAADDNPIQREGYARYSHFFVEGSGSNYTLRVSGFSGNVVDSFLGHTGYQFSTYDNDHDISGSNCANSYKGGWWYSNCHSSNLNGWYLKGDHSSYANGVEWSRTWGYHYSLIQVEMRIKCT